MIRIEEEKLIIEISHVCPDEFSEDLKTAIITAVQNQSEDGLDLKEINDVNYTLLELLKSLL